MTSSSLFVLLYYADGNYTFKILQLVSTFHCTPAHRLDTFFMVACYL
jgi:hypothetical protein